MTHTIRVWDLPTRLFHWLLVLCVLGLVITGKIGGGAIVWHARLGYAVLALLLFRLVWGFAGGHWSRFSRFLRGPASVIAYLKGTGPLAHRVGHNPLGALSVLAMLAVLIAQVGTGLVSDDEISFTGPLNRFVSSSLGLAATSYHKQIGQWLIIGLVVLHVGAVLIYLWKKRENLVRPMITGDKEWPEPAPSSRDDGKARTIAAVVLALCAGVAVAVARLGG